MSAAVASRVQQQNPPHNTSTSKPRMATNSPIDSKRTSLKSEDPSKRDSPLRPAKDAGTVIPQKQEITSSLPNPTIVAEAAPPSDVEATQPLAPPPRPAANRLSDTPSYLFNIQKSTQLSHEPNPFEQSFGNPSADTQGSLLPPPDLLASPSSLLQGGGPLSAGIWGGSSLRAGPLSPAMLTGPTPQNIDYFSDAHLRGGFPTPNESGLRTGLTPGGGGSMFPAPSPNTQAIFNQLGAPTPSTLDFHRTALSAAASRKLDPAADRPSNGAASQIHNQNSLVPDGSNHLSNPLDVFGQHDANDAANGLFLLAQQRTNVSAPNQYATQHSQQEQLSQPTNMVAAPSLSVAPIQNSMGAGQIQTISPTISKRTTRNMTASGANHADTARGISEMSVELSDGVPEPPKPVTRNRGKRAAPPPAKAGTAATRRKADDPAPSKPPPAKKAKANAGLTMPNFNEDSDEAEEEDQSKLEYHENGKKLTDDEKRKNFLERNRVAALKCRQRKKQWLANLQNKVELFSSENDALSSQVAQLREEIVNLKTLLLAHKDCPVSQVQGLSTMVMNNIANELASTHNNPFALSMSNGIHGHGVNLQRKYDS